MPKVATRHPPLLPMYASRNPRVRRIHDTVMAIQIYEGQALGQQKRSGPYWRLCNRTVTTDGFGRSLRPRRFQQCFCPRQHFIALLIWAVLKSCEVAETSLKFTGQIPRFTSRAKNNICVHVCTTYVYYTYNHAWPICLIFW